MNGNQISQWIAELGIWPLVVVLVPNLMFRRYGQGTGKKRMASLFQAIAVFAITTSAAFIVEREFSDTYLYIAIAVVAAVLVIFRRQVFPYRMTCPQCDKRLDFKTIYFMDDHLCRVCREKNTENQPPDESTGMTDASSSSAVDGDVGE